MKTAGKKAKGRTGQKEVRDFLLGLFPELEEDDIRSTPMGTSGEDLLLSPKAREWLPFSIEIKRKKRFSVARYIEQAESHSDYSPIVFLREDRGEWLVLMKAEDYFS